MVKFLASNGPEYFFIPTGRARFRRILSATMLVMVSLLGASNTDLVIEGNVNRDSIAFGGGITLAWDERNVTIRRNTIRACGAGTNDEQGEPL